MNIELWRLMWFAFLATGAVFGWLWETHHVVLYYKPAQLYFHDMLGPTGSAFFCVMLCFGWPALFIVPLVAPYQLQYHDTPGK